MGFFKEIATPLIEQGIPVVPLRPKTKDAFQPDWPNLATTDIKQIEEWDIQYPNSNCGSVAKAEPGAVWFFEFDSPAVPERVFADTKQKLPDTLKVRSSPGKGHVYLRQNSLSLAMGNLPQGYVKGGDWSARVHNQYVVSPGSLHPGTGLPYEFRSTAPIVEAPEWFINWCISQKLDKKKNEEVPRDVNNKIPHGFIHDQCVAMAGRFVNLGMSTEGVEEALVSWVVSNCAEPLDLEHVRQVARSTNKWKRGNPLENVILIGGKPAGSVSQITQTVSVEPTAQELAEAPVITPVPYPKFPDWVMKGTSIYEGLVKPFCDVNSRYESFMWLPAMTVMLNYLGTKIRVANKNLIPSIFMVSIGRRGKVIKSSSVEDSIKYFEYAGIVGQHEGSMNNADGRSLIVTPASPEGLGKELQRTNCKNFILYYDELKDLVSKSSIESSTLSTKLLQLYENSKFENIVKNPKDSFSILPGTYCCSMIACSTDKNFVSNWSKLSGKSSGLDDRCIFLLQPEVLKPLTPYIHVNTQEGAIKTRQLIDKAVQQGVFHIVDSSPLSKFTAENDDSNRAEIRAEKFALGIAVDLGLSELDEECIERGLAIVAYEQSVKRYLRTYEAETKEGGIQMELMYTLRKAGGAMTSRDLQRVMNSARYGTTLWGQAYAGLIRSGWIREEGGGVKTEPKRVILLRVVEEDED